MAENEIMTLDEYVIRPQRYIVSGGLDKDEIRYKIDIGKQLEAARKAVLSGDPNWPALVRDGFKNNLVRWTTVNALLTWIDTREDDALDAMQALWAEGDTPIGDRIREFVPLVQPPRLQGASYHNNFNGPGTRLRLISTLMMALDFTKYPPYGQKYFVKEGYQRTGYSMPPKGADEATLYEHALGFLDKLVDRAYLHGYVRPCNRLEAQSIVWSYKYPERFG